MEKIADHAEASQEPDSMTETSPEEADREFRELFSFLCRYHWIHDLQITKFFESKVWDQMPEEWIRAFSNMSVEDLNHLPFQNTTHSTTEASSSYTSLTTFLQQASHLSQRRLQSHVSCPPTTHVDADLRKGMSPKKLHEVERMASLVHQVALESGCNVVVDVGSGLGYLGQVLHKRYGLPVIGLESSQGHSSAAEKRAAKQGLQCSGMRSVPFMITQDKENVQALSDLVHDIARSFQPCLHSSAASGLLSHHPDRLPSHQTSAENVCHLGDGVLSSELCPCSSANSRLCHHPDRLPSHCPENVCCHSDGVTSSEPCQCSSAENVCCQGNSVSSRKHFQHSSAKNFWQRGNGNGNLCVTDDAKKSRNIDELKNESENGDGELRVCLIGLHCCGDLTPAMLRLYRDVSFLRALCCVSCCYHKMQLLPGSDHFANFPMSESASTAYTEVCGHKRSSLSTSASPLSSSTSSSATPSSSESSGVFLTPCSLRLGAQETRVRWVAQTAENHHDHTRHVAFRAILEILFKDTDQTTVDRKSVRKLDYTTFDSFVQSYLSAVRVQGEEQAQELQSRLRMLYDKHREYFQHIEPFTCLQVVLQPVLEWTVLWDRHQWLTEQGLTSDLRPVFDEHVSPRNLALISVKSRSVS